MSVFLALSTFHILLKNQICVYDRYMHASCMFHHRSERRVDLQKNLSQSNADTTEILVNLHIQSLATTNSYKSWIEKYVYLHVYRKVKTIYTSSDTCIYMLITINTWAVLQPYVTRILYRVSEVREMSISFRQVIYLYNDM